MIRHISAIAEVVDDVDAAVEFYRDVLGLTVEHQPGGGYATVEIPGVLHFSIWSRSAAAEATYGDKDTADRIPLGFSVEFEVDSVDSTPPTPSASAAGRSSSRQRRSRGANRRAASRSPAGCSEGSRKRRGHVVSARTSRWNLNDLGRLL